MSSVVKHNNSTQFASCSTTTQQLTMNIKINICAIALLATTSDCFVSNPGRTRNPTLKSIGKTGVASPWIPPTHSVSRLSAASGTFHQTPNDEAERLKAMATKLRQEAASLEAQQRDAMTKAAQNMFRKFDQDNNGFITPHELRQGLEKLFKIELPEKRAEQLVQAFDENGDGTLQLEEFVGVEKFKNKLDALVREERDLERQQAKQAEDEARAAQIAEARMELVNDKAPTSCLLYTSPSPRDRTRSRMPSSD